MENELEARVQRKLNDIKIPIGGAFISNSGENPNTVFGYGVWSLEASGTITLSGGTTGVKYVWLRTA